jgi:hypothetical protein
MTLKLTPSISTEVNSAWSFAPTPPIRFHDVAINVGMEKLVVAMCKQCKKKANLRHQFQVIA